MDAGALGFSNSLQSKMFLLVQSKNTDRPRRVKTLKTMLRDTRVKQLSGTVVQPSLNFICKLQDLRVLLL